MAAACELPRWRIYIRAQTSLHAGIAGALPSLEAKESKRLVSIKGTPPDLLIPLKHCPFAWRCDYAFDRCWEEIPPLISVGDKHQAACFFDIEEGGPHHD